MKGRGMYGLPLQVKFCKKCVISNQRPSSAVEFKAKRGDDKETISFGEDGICSACKFAEYKNRAIDWKDREKKLVDLCNKHRSKDGKYDCIVPGSGGKDSSFAAHILKYKYGMNPLTVTWAPHIYTEAGWNNLQSLINVGGVDNILFTPNGRVHSMLTKTAFETLLHPFQPFIIGQKYIAPKTALHYKVPLIFYGENQAEYGNNVKENEVPTMQEKFFAQDVNINELFLGGVSAKKLIDDGKLSINDLDSYLPAPKNEIKKLGVEVHYLGYYLKWDQQENFYYCVKNTGFKPNTERTEGTYSKYCSIDDKIDRFHFYTYFIKFGMGQATYDAVQEIRTGKITREEAVALVRRYDGEFPRSFFKDFLDYTGISEEKFWERIDAGRPKHLWQKVKGEWKLKHQVSN
jgi:N-acetyl sugar amidotransferase